MNNKKKKKNYQNCEIDIQSAATKTIQKIVQFAKIN